MLKLAHCVAFDKLPLQLGWFLKGSLGFCGPNEHDRLLKEKKSESKQRKELVVFE